MTNEHEAQIFYQTFDKDKDENNTRIFIFAGLNDGKNFYANEDILYNESFVESIQLAYSKRINSSISRDSLIQTLILD